VDAAWTDRVKRLLVHLADWRLARRAMVGLVGGLAASAGIKTAAKKKDKDKKDKKKKRKKKKRKNRCRPDCTGKVCGSNGCGGSCGACAETEVCLAGDCARFCHVCASGCLFDSIPLALASAPPGATIILCSETFAGTVNVVKDVTIVGAGADPTETVLEGSAANNPVLNVQSGRTATVRNLTITGVQLGAQGAVGNVGTLTLEAVHVIDNDAADWGGIFNFAGATLNLTDSLVQGNSSTTLGGGIRNQTGLVTLTRSDVEGNEAPKGGGIANEGGTVNLTDESRVTGNTATGDNGVFGGGVFNQGMVTLSGGSTIEDNIPDDCVDDNGSGCP
jgi:hypothetical protein